MPLPIKTLPIIERWDCSSCGRCCHGDVIPLDDNDLQKLREQGWEQHPEMSGIRIVVRQGWFGGNYQLAQRDDGTCVFLTEDNLCLIHKEFGFENKPWVCRMFPLQLVPTGDKAVLTLRRSCPTAAADSGRELSDHRRDAKRYSRERPQLAEATVPPRIARSQRRSWKDTQRVLSGIESLLTDDRFPLIRRIVHGLRFCDLLEQCKLGRLDEKQLFELVTILTEEATQNVGDRFADRQPPSRSASLLFRQIMIAYLRLHPLYAVQESWRQRWRLMRAAFQFARGRNDIPLLHPDFPSTTFEDIEQPLGHLEEELQRPFNSYFETHVMSRQYAIVTRRDWSIVEKFRALALTYPIALWMVRYFCRSETPKRQDAIDIVTALDRGQGYRPLTSSMHRRRIATLARTSQLDRLAIWYAR